MFSECTAFRWNKQSLYLSLLTINLCKIKTILGLPPVIRNGETVVENQAIYNGCFLFTEKKKLESEGITSGDPQWENCR